MAKNLLFHKVSEKEKEEIKEGAKKIIQDFSKELSKIDKKIPDQIIKRPSNERKESIEDKEKFSRETMFKNAPNKNKEFIIAEKKKW